MSTPTSRRNIPDTSQSSLLPSSLSCFRSRVWIGSRRGHVASHSQSEPGFSSCRANSERENEDSPSTQHDDLPKQGATSHDYRTEAIGKRTASMGGSRSRTKATRLPIRSSHCNTDKIPMWLGVYNVDSAGRVALCARRHPPIYRGAARVGSELDSALSRKVPKENGRYPFVEP